VRSTGALALAAIRISADMERPPFAESRLWSARL
jgi:hypothetical protein